MERRLIFRVLRAAVLAASGGSVLLGTPGLADAQAVLPDVLILFTPPPVGGSPPAAGTPTQPRAPSASTEPAPVHVGPTFPMSPVQGLPSKEEAAVYCNPSHRLSYVLQCPK